MRGRCLADAGGFSLIESLLAGALLSVGVLALAQVFVVTVSATSAARRSTLASILATQKIEELLAGPLRLTGAGSEPIGEFTRAWTVTPHEEDSLNTAVIQVTVAPGAGALIVLRTRTVP